LLSRAAAKAPSNAGYQALPAPREAGQSKNVKQAGQQLGTRGYKADRLGGEWVQLEDEGGK
tara:strand:- start:415 stop:597 length:183 start_codon:yes stop_codon:yes gene_type:complete